jgi:hypothetical protein
MNLPLTLKTHPPNMIFIKRYYPTAQLTKDTPLGTMNLPEYILLQKEEFKPEIGAKVGDNLRKRITSNI